MALPPRPPNICGLIRRRPVLTRRYPAKYRERPKVTPELLKRGLVFFFFFADATMSNVALPGGGVLRGECLSLLTN